MASQDLRRIVAGWGYEPNQIAVRKIPGDDGSIKIQMRVDLGVLQMEMSGRPDGAKPHGSESLLAFHEDCLRKHVELNGTELGFELNQEECSALREEAVQYYHRYLAEFVLEDFEAVERDTGRNLRVLDICSAHASFESDRVILEQHRPYLVMMNARAAAHLALRSGAFRTAAARVKAAIRELEHLALDADDEEDCEDSAEMSILQSLAREVEARLPEDPLQKLEAELKRALDEERYEDAATLRDRINAMQSQRTDVPNKKRDE